MRINDITLLGALRSTSVVVLPAHVASVPAPATVASPVSTCALTNPAVAGVEGTLVSSSAGWLVVAGAESEQAVEAIQVKAAKALVLKQLAGGGQGTDVRGYGADQRIPAYAPVERQMQDEVRTGGSVTATDSTNGNNGTNGTNPFSPWDFRTSSPPG